MKLYIFIIFYDRYHQNQIDTGYFQVSLFKKKFFWSLNIRSFNLNTKRNIILPYACSAHKEPRFIGTEENTIARTIEAH